MMAQLKEYQQALVKRMERTKAIGEQMAMT
jgi:hypothetical protein